ncbi:phloem protein 2 A5, partial [Striga asiatica]
MTISAQSRVRNLKISTYECTTSMECFRSHPNITNEEVVDQYLLTDFCFDIDNTLSTTRNMLTQMVKALMFIHQCRYCHTGSSLLELDIDGVKNLEVTSQHEVVDQDLLTDFHFDIDGTLSTTRKMLTQMVKLMFIHQCRYCHTGLQSHYSFVLTEGNGLLELDIGGVKNLEDK